MSTSKPRAPRYTLAHAPIARLGLLLVLAALILACGLAPAASATDYTWSGGGGSGADAWSNGANWLGDVAPAPESSIGTLTFPKLAAGAGSKNDLNGLSVEQLQLDNSHGLGISGDGLTLGSGGLTLDAAEAPPIVSTAIATPLILSSNQTWNISAPIGSGPLVAPDDVSLEGQLSGESADLTINLHTFSDLVFGSFFADTTLDDELGNVTINGVDTSVPLSQGAVVYKSEVSLPASFNATDGKRLTVHDLSLSSEGATGPITAINSGVGLSGPNIGPVTSISSGIRINGNVASVNLDSASGLNFSVGASGSTPGTDYTQTTSTGTIGLNSASLEMANEGVPGEHEFSCPPPHVGQAYTLIATTGSLTGSFGNAPEGATIDSSPCAATHKNGEPYIGRIYRYRINYLSGATKTVTATALPAVPTLFEEPEPPTISGMATQGQTLSLAHGFWSNEPTSYADQWQRCDSTGTNCQSIAGATGQTYSLTAADVGSTIRVTETASNGEGTSSPASSAASAVVQAGATEPPSNNGGGTTTTNTGNPPVLPPGSCCDGPDPFNPVNPAQLKALLARQLEPAAGVSIAGLLKHGGLVLPFKAPEAGTATIQWFEVPAGAQLARKSKAKAVLVASGQASFRAAGPGVVKIRLTSAGRKLLKRGKRIRLEAEGRFASEHGFVVATQPVRLR